MANTFSLRQHIAAQSVDQISVYSSCGDPTGTTLMIAASPLGLRVAVGTAATPGVAASSVLISFNQDCACCGEVASL